MKKTISLFLVLCLFSCLSITAIAGETTTLSVTPGDAIVTTDENQVVPFGWPGTGVAPQITKIEVSKAYWLDNGNFGIQLKVTGYGNDRDSATFNGKKVTGYRGSYFINYGTTADGWYWDYDCGPVTEPGTYVFKATFTSTNSPYSKLTIEVPLTFQYKEA